MKFNIKAAVLTICLCFTITASFAIEQMTVEKNAVLNIKDCIEIALQNSPLIKKSRYNYGLAKGNLGIAKSEYFPTLGIGTGYNITDAAVKLQRAGLKVKTVGSGDTVISQYPAYGTSVAAGSTIIAYTEEGVSSMVTVPDLVGKNPSATYSALTALGLNIKEEGAYSGNSGVTVSAQSPAAGDKVPMGTVVTVTYMDKSSLE